MKVLCFIFLLGGLYCNKVSGQIRKLPLKMDLPKGENSITKAQYHARLTNGNKKDALEYYPTIIEKDGVFISYDFNTKYDVREWNTLEEWKQQLDAMNAKYDNEIIYDSRIVTIGSVRFVIQRHEEGGMIYINYYSDFIDKTNIVGIVKCTKADEPKAKQMLNDILKTLKLNTAP